MSILKPGGYPMVARCANDMCCAIYRQKHYEPWSAFCPCCRAAIVTWARLDKIMAEKQKLDEMSH